MAWSGQFLLVHCCVSLRRSNNCCELKAIISRVKNRINAIQPFGFNNNIELCKMPHNHISSRKMFFFFLFFFVRLYVVVRGRSQYCVLGL